MLGHMNRETVISHAEAVYKALRDQHKYSEEQIRRICTHIVRKIGKLKSAKTADLEQKPLDQE